MKNRRAGGNSLFSEGVNLWLQQFSKPWLDQIFLGITYLGSEYVYLALLTFIYWCVNRKSGRHLFLAFLVSVWINSVLKDALGLPRPSGDIVRVMAYEWSSGFPSGHAQTAAVVWAYIAMRWPKRWIIVTSAVLVALISVSRLYLGVHYLGQVLAGLALGLGCAAVAYYLEKHNKPAPQPQGWRTCLTVILCYLAAIPVQSEDGFRIAGVLLGFLLTDAIPRRIGTGVPDTPYTFSEPKLTARVRLQRALIGWGGLGAGYVAVKLFAAPGLPAMLSYSALAAWVTAGAPFVFRRLGLGQWQQKATAPLPKPYPIPADVPVPGIISFAPTTTPLMLTGLCLLLATGLTLPELSVFSKGGSVPALDTTTTSTLNQLPALHTEATFLVLGHKGGEGLAPGNTLAAFGQGLQVGAHVLECDVRRTLDGHLVVVHDERVDAITNGTGTVDSLTLKELRQLDGGYHFSFDGETYPYRGKDVRISTLESVLEAYPNAKFNIDMKDHNADTPAALLAVLDATDARNRVIIASFDGPTIRRFRQLAPEIPTTLASDEVMRFTFMTRLGLGTFFHPPARYIQIPERQGPIQLATPATFKLAHRLGMDVHVWTVNNRLAMRRFVEEGADGIITDYPDRLVDVLTGPNAGVR